MRTLKTNFWNANVSLKPVSAIARLPLYLLLEVKQGQWFLQKKIKYA